MNTLLLKALKCENNQRAPAWLMRQAGRYMANYRALRQRFSFIEMCHQPELIAEVTLQPIERFQPDAAIIFSDILVIAEALGRGLRFEENAGPTIERPLQGPEDLKLLPKPDISKLRYVAEGIKLVKPHLQVPLIGFCGAPFTVASYMIEGGSSRDLKNTKKWMFTDPSSFEKLLDLIADWSIAYLRMQIEAGANVIQIFDSWANVLAYDQFCEFALPAMKKIIGGIQDLDIPVIAFCRGSSIFAVDLVKAKPQAISLDWNCSLKAMRDVIPTSIALQGNLDPAVLLAPIPVIEREVKKLLKSMQGDPGFIFNLGHGITPDIKEEAVECLFQTVKEGVI